MTDIVPQSQKDDAVGSGNVTQRLAAHVRAQGWAELIAFRAGDRAWTFAEVFSGAARVASGYRAAKVGYGERVLLALPDGIELVWCLLGAWQAGVVAIPVNVQLSRADLTRDVTTAEPALIVVDEETTGWLAAAGCAPATTVDELLSDDPDTRFAEGGDAVALGLFTSGTTGAPKLCFFRHRNLGGQRGPSGVHHPGTVGLSVSRMYFMAGLNVTLFTTLETGMTAVLSRPRATPASALELMRRHQVTVLFAQPSFMARLLLEPGHEEVLGRLRLAMCVGEVLSARLRARLVPILGERLVNRYGITEIGGIVAFGRPADYDRPSAVGPAFTGRSVRVVDADGRTLPRGERGELHVHVPFVSRGVPRGSLGIDQLTDTWWPTGDLASIDENEVVHVYGRLDDVEVVGGQNVVPGEIEGLLETHPHVLEAAVCSVRRPAGDTSLRAFVVAANGIRPPDTELIDLVRARLSWYKVPQDVVWLDALPRNGNGKIMRRQLRAWSSSDASGGPVAESSRQHANTPSQTTTERVSRLATEMLAAVHDIIRRHKLTYAEYDALKSWLIQVGKDGEWPLFLDVFVEHQVEQVANANRPGGKGSIEGPYYVPGAPVFAGGEAALPHHNSGSATPLLFSGRVVGTSGAPLPGARLEIWHTDENGRYSQFSPGIPDWNLRGIVITDGEGRFRIRTILPAPYRIPTGGAIGQLIAAAGWSSWRPAHLHAKIAADGYQTITTQLYFRDSEHLESDIASAVKPELILDLRPAPDGPGKAVTYDFVLAPSAEPR